MEVNLSELNVWVELVGEDKEVREWVEAKCVIVAPVNRTRGQRQGTQVVLIDHTLDELKYKER